MKQKKSMLCRIISLLLLFIFEINICYPISYSGTSYTGSNYVPKTYSGIELEPVEYDGELLYPLSYSGTVINGVYYEGIDLTNYKITTLKISGKETDSDFFNENVPVEYRVNWKKVIGKFAIGTTVIVITGIVSLCGGTIPLATAGYIAAGAFKGAITGSVIGAATDAFFSATLAFFKGEPKEKTFKETIESSADGFMWGSLTGAIAGGFKSAKELSKGKALLNSKGKIQYIRDNNGFVYDPKEGKALGKIFNKNKSGNYLYFRNENGQFVDFDGNLHNIKMMTDGRLLENGNVIGLIDPRDGLIATNKSDIEKTIKELWEPIVNCKHLEGSYEHIKIGATVTSDGKILKNNYKTFYNVTVPRYSQAHHILPKKGHGEFGAKLRQIFSKYNIDINDPHNCVLLPDDDLRCKVLNMMQHHKELHGKDENKIIQSLYEDMSRCISREQVFDVLADYRQAMLTNTPFWL